MRRLGMRGLYFTMTGFFRNGYRTLPDDPAFDPLWRAVARLDLPVFWVHSAKSPAGDYLDEMRRLRASSSGTRRSATCWSTACRPVSMRTRRTGSSGPSAIVELLDRGPVWTEVLYPIAWGGRMPYPYARAQDHFRQIYERFGAGRLIWGSDMPNVGRYCTYRQALAYIWDHADFLPEGIAGASSARTRWACSRRPARAER